MRVATEESMATKAEKGNFCHGLLGKHGDCSIAKESGRTCMKPVERMTPEAKAFTTKKRFLSGDSAGTDREKSGKQMPIMLATRMVAMAMTFSFRALGRS
ncbi:unnamed protein product [Spirodela intermedia]|uniref:Uncharacterized protein n=1 Tax=Spirodela intermedia TaxID=51605 RepID=A0A7I8K9E6_SPIIN|nr:unnamed protein product [Spirodela intermedia]